LLILVIEVLPLRFMPYKTSFLAKWSNCSFRYFSFKKTEDFNIYGSFL